MLQPKKSLSFLIFLLLSVALAVGTPAGEEITNQATAKYIDSAGDQQTANSNQVITVVAQVFGVSIVADGTTGAPGQSQNVTPGSTVYYPYTLTNTGNGIDDFNLTTDIDTDGTSDDGSITTPVYFLDADGDGVVDSGESTPITSITDLPADESVKIIMAYQIPTAADAADVVIASPIGTSANDPAGTPASDANNYHQSTVIQDATMVVSKSVNVSEADPGDTLTYTITATNTGSKNATTVTVTDAVPTGTTIVGASVTTIPAGNAASTSIPTAIFATVIPGQTVRMSFSVTIDAGTLPGDVTNVATVAYTNSASATTTATTNEVVTEVLASYGAAVGPKDDPLDGLTGDSATIVSYTSSEGYAVTSTADDSDTQTVDQVDAGDSASFINSVRNTGTDTDTFNFTFSTTNLPTANGYSVVLTRLDGTPLSDTDGDGIPDSGPLAKDAEFDFIVKVLTPANANDTDDATTVHTVVVTATSSEDATQTDTTTNVIEDILGPGVAFGNNTDVDVDGADDDAVDSTAVVNQTDDPGESVVFPMDVVNTGSNTDSYDLTGTVNFTDVDGSTITVAVDYYPASADTNSDGTLSDAEIAAATPITNTGNINPDTDAEITVFAVVDIPEGATPQVATVSQTVTSPLSGSTASFNSDTITVNAIKDFSFSPDRNGTVPSPGTVIYQHSLTNNGNQNITDIDLSEAASGNTAGWTYVYSYNGTTYFPAASLPATTITPGANQTLFVKVNAPAGVPQNATNIVTITAQPTFGSDSSATGSDSVTDTTTVISGELNIVKEWSADGGTTWFKGDGTDATTPPEVAPGSDILYRMTVINIGTGNVTDTQVLDSVPTFTDFVVASAVFETTQGSSDTVTCSTDGGATFPAACPTTPVTTPASIASSINAIQFFIDELVPGASVEVRFAVRVQ